MRFLTKQKSSLQGRMVECVGAQAAQRRVSNWGGPDTWATCWRVSRQVVSGPQGRGCGGTKDPGLSAETQDVLAGQGLCWGKYRACLKPVH